MTGYELASLFAQISDNFAAQLTNLTTLVSIYLGAGYLVAHRLTLPSAIVFTGIFVFIGAGSILFMVRATQSLMGVGHEIRVFAEQGRGLAWHQAAFVPELIETTLPIAGAIGLAAIMIGAVYFFFASRRQNLRLQPPAVPQSAAATVA